LSDEKKEVNIKDIIREEYKKCLLNPQYFIRKYCFIQEPVRGRILFDLYKYQENSIDDFEKYQFNVILKGRQIGISTAVACYALWLMLFHRDKNVLVIATKESTAKNLITKVRFAYENLPIWLQVPCTENNKLGQTYKNGSRIQASTAAGDAGRSEALSLLILDECAFIKNAKEIWVAALPTVSTGGKAVLISTPNGVGNFFHKVYTEAEQGQRIAAEEGADEILFHPIKLDWRVHPNRDQAWRDKMGKAQGEREARQEYDAEFIGSGNTVVDEYLIEWYKNKKRDEGEDNGMCRDPLEKTGFDSNFWIWIHPDYTKRYAVVADVARGDGSDYSTAQVIDLDEVEQVAEYKGKLGTTEFAHLLMSIATMYNQALLVVERENHGWAVIQQIINKQYPLLFYMSKDRQVIEVERNLTNRHHAEDKKLVPGFTTSMKTRPLIIDKLDTYMREKQVKIHSLRLLTELETFIWDNGKAQAMEGYNDDLTMAAGIGLWIRDTTLRLQQEGVEIQKTALDAIKRVGYDGVYTPNHLPFDPYKMPTNGLNEDDEDSDFRWVL
jgi:hypothetical protein